MRRVLETLYRLSGLLAAVALVALAVLVSAQIAGRFFGFIIIFAGDMAGYLLVATSFLAMASTFRNGVHVRVSLVLVRLPERLRRPVEIWSLAFATAMAGYFAWATIDMTWESYVYNDLSTGHVAFELWMPQTALAVGVTILFVAMVDTLVSVLRGETPAYLAAARDDTIPAE